MRTIEATAGFFHSERLAGSIDDLKLDCSDKAPEYAQEDALLLTTIVGLGELAATLRELTAFGLLLSLIRRVAGGAFRLFAKGL